MRPMASTEGQVKEERLVRLEGFSVAYVLYGLVHQVLGEMVTLLWGGGRLYAGTAGNQVRIPLAGVGLKESVEPLKSPAHWPLVVRSCCVDRIGRRKVPLAHAIRIVPLPNQHLRHGRCFFR